MFKWKLCSVQYWRNSSYQKRKYFNIIFDEVYSLSIFDYIILLPLKYNCSIETVINNCFIYFIPWNVTRLKKQTNIHQISMIICTDADKDRMEWIGVHNYQHLSINP